MIAETTAYRLLSNDKKLNELFDSYRGSKFGNGFKQGMFTYDIPERPVNLKVKNLAPFLRINTINDSPTNYADDKIIIEEQRIVINFWCATASQCDAIAVRIDEILEENGFERYTANENPRFKDADIDLLMNVRKYRVFDFKNRNEEHK